MKTRILGAVALVAVLGTQAGEIREPVSNIDMAPTFCDIAGCTLGPYPTGQKKPDGLSLLPLLKGETSRLNASCNTSHCAT